MTELADTSAWVVAPAGSTKASPSRSWVGRRPALRARRGASSAPSEAAAEEEFGDLLFALVNYARHRGWDPEQSLAQANDKFLKRFKAMEALLAARGEPNAKQSLEVWDALWNQVKRNEN